ncbi:MAG TPA: hypothetical protein PKC12_02935 [Thiobacillaceae bacterium]|nr:hypothetical protein [Thiobacillaceae bacterium]
MQFFGAMILVALVLLAAFTLANWSVLTATTTLSFIVFSLEGPLGVILLGAILVLVTLFVLYALTLRTSMLMEARRHAQEMEAQRKLAESAEASRLAELRSEVSRDFADLQDRIAGFDGQMGNHVQAMQRALDEAANGLAAMVGEVDDKIDRVLASSTTEVKGIDV